MHLCACVQAYVCMSANVHVYACVRLPTRRKTCNRKYPQETSRRESPNYTEASPDRLWVITGTPAHTPAMNPTPSCLCLPCAEWVSALVPMLPLCGCMWWYMRLAEGLRKKTRPNQAQQVRLRLGCPPLYSVPPPAKAMLFLAL